MSLIIDPLYAKIETEKTAAHLEELYKCSRYFFLTGYKLKLFGKNWTNNVFGFSYWADRLVQSYVWGKHDALRPERGTRGLKPHDLDNMQTKARENIQKQLEGC